MSEDKDQSEQNIVENNTLPVIFVDGFSFSLRSDDICFIQFGATTPDYIYEQTRMMIPREAVTQLINTACEILDYNPNDKESEEKND